MTKEYYRKNKHLWRKGGRYYKYSPRTCEGGLIVRKGKFLIYFN